MFKSEAWKFTRNFISRPSFFIPPALGLLAAAVYSIAVDELYSSSAIVLPVKQDRSANALAQLAGRFGGIGGLIGGTLTSEESQRNLQIMQSRHIGELFIQKMDLLPHLYPERWDARNKKWLPKKGFLFGLLPAGKDAHEPPSMWRAFERLEDRRTIHSDDFSGTIKVTYRFQDPVFAQKVTTEFIRFVNDYIREKDRVSVDDNINFIMEELQGKSLVPLKEALTTVAEDQLEKRMFIEARQEYAFEVLDPATLEDEPSQPKRLLAFALGVAGGIFFGVFLTLFLATLKGKEQQ